MNHIPIALFSNIPGHGPLNPDLLLVAELTQRRHSTHLPPALARKINKENYSPARRDAVLEILKRLGTEMFDHPIAIQATEFVRSN